MPRQTQPLQRSSSTRVVGYIFDDAATATALKRAAFNTAVDRLLARQLQLNVISQYGVGRQVIWFNGAPGKALRSLRRQIRDLVTP